MDTSDILALAGLTCSSAAAAWATVVAHRANGRAKDANRIAAAALAETAAANDLAQRQDGRRRERRDVSWRASWLDEKPGTPARWQLTNTGTTPAHEVTAVLHIPGTSGRAVELGNIAPGSSGIATPFPDKRTQEQIRLLRREVDAYTVHWASPLGEPGVEDHIPPQIF